MRLDSRLAAAGIMAAVFVSGGITGGVLSRTLLDDGPRFERRWDGDRRDFVRRGERGGPDRDRHEGPREPPRNPRALMSSRAVDYLAARLELSQEQHDSLDAVLERQRERAAAVFDDVGPRLRTLLDSTYSQIRVVLTPEQRAEFDAILQEDRGVLGRRYVPRDSTRER